MQKFEKSRGAAAAISTPVTFFKPRQLLLKSKSNMKHEKDNGIRTPISLSDEQRRLLLQSICQYFEQSGFSKTLKKFRKEADIEKESWKSCLLNLEEMCCLYLKMRDDAKTRDSAIKEQATNQKDDNDKEKKTQEEIENHPVDDVKPKKKKKKSKSGSDVHEQIAEETHLKPSKEPEGASLSVPSEPEKKSKDKKKKKHKDAPQDSGKEETTELPAVEFLEKPDAVAPEEMKETLKNRKKKEDTSHTEDLSVENTEIDKGEKGSKKRKKSVSEENETGCIEKEVFDDSKRRKTDNIDQSNGTILSKTPNGSVNGVLEQDEKGSQKDKTKLGNESAEPRTAANAFRRVKEEDVEFVDERLQDNSYWAKDGAESGYGAKAQEVLGQVRGRDFRHEKTKKKRGSYRGGQIDLDSHSIKFNYDDDE